MLALSIFIFPAPGSPSSFKLEKREAAPLSTELESGALQKGSADLIGCKSVVAM